MIKIVYVSVNQGALEQDSHRLFAQRLFRARHVEFPR